MIGLFLERKCDIKHIENDWMSIQHFDDQKRQAQLRCFDLRVLHERRCRIPLFHPTSKDKITEYDGNLIYQSLVYSMAKVLIDARHKTGFLFSSFKWFLSQY
jgi:hypothetical protein